MFSFLFTTVIHLSCLVKWLEVCIAVNGTSSHSYWVSLASWDHTVLPAIQIKWTHPALIPARQAGTRFTYHGGMKAELTYVTGYIPRWFTCPRTVTHPSTNPAVHGQESNSQPVDYKSDALTTTSIIVIYGHEVFNLHYIQCENFLLPKNWMM